VLSWPNVHVLIGIHLNENDFSKKLYKISIKFRMETIRMDSGLAFLPIHISFLAVITTISLEKNVNFKGRMDWMWMVCRNIKTQGNTIGCAFCWDKQISISLSVDCVFIQLSAFAMFLWTPILALIRPNHSFKIFKIVRAWDTIEIEPSSLKFCC
jgi:hypothetical protein